MVFFAVAATAVSMMLLVRLLQNVVSAKWLASTALIAMSFLYVGFSLPTDDAGVIAFECIVALFFFAIATIGYKKDSRLIALGILLHGIWDYIHHLTAAAHVSPSYWPEYCATVDFIWAVCLYFIFR